MYVINGLQDQTTLYIWKNTIHLLGVDQYRLVDLCKQYVSVINSVGNPMTSSQPVFLLITKYMLFLLDWIFLPLSALITIFLTLLSSYILFKKYRYWYIYAAIFSSCSYFWIKFGIHQELMQVWLFVLFILSLLAILFDSRRYFRNYVALTALLILSTLISNYLGFVMLVTCLAVIVSYFLFLKFKDRLGLVKLRNLLVCLVSAIAIIVMSIFPYIRAAFFTTEENVPSIGYYARPYEDFVTFSLRPWYFFTPSPKNPIYGEFSKNITAKIESTGYFLADDYFPAEHSAAFFGYLFLITFAGCLIYGYKKLDTEIKQKVNVLLLTTILLISFTMPPFFTIAGWKIYTPGHLIATFFPMFRVTARFSPMILLLMLLIMAEIINVIHVNKPKFFKYFMPILLVVTLAETFVPFKITKYDKVPDPYLYMGAQQPMTIKYLVYPYSKSNESLFWLPDHKQCLMNVRGYRFTNISAEELTLKIFEPGMIDTGKELGVTHIPFYEPEKYSEQISTLNMLEEVQVFSDATLYKIN